MTLREPCEESKLSLVFDDDGLVLQGDGFDDDGDISLDVSCQDVGSTQVLRVSEVGTLDLERYVKSLNML